MIVKKFKNLSSALFFLLVAGCFSGQVKSQTLADYFPSQQGKVYTYKTMGSKEIVKVDSVTTIGNKKVISFTSLTYLDKGAPLKKYYQYSIDENEVVQITLRDDLVASLSNNQKLSLKPVLLFKKPNAQWLESDSTSNIQSSSEFQTYKDPSGQVLELIVATKTTSRKDPTYAGIIITYKDYYAKGAGLIKTEVSSNKGMNYNQTELIVQ